MAENMSLFKYFVFHRRCQLTCLLLMTLIHLFAVPYTGASSYFYLQAIFDFTFLGFPRFLNLLNNLLHGSVDFRHDTRFSLGFMYFEEPFNGIHDYRYTEYTWDHDNNDISPDFKSFVGPLIISLFTFPWSFFSPGHDKFYVQVIARITVTTMNLTALFYFIKAATRKFGFNTISIFIFVTLSQYHFLHNLTQMTPNCLSMFMVLMSSAAWMNHRGLLFLTLATITVTVFHSVTFLLFLPMALHSLFVTRNITLGNVICRMPMLGFLFALGSAGFESFMWGEYVWPQYRLIVDFLAENSTAHECCLSLFSWYILHGLPEYLMISILFIPFATRKAMKSAFFVSLVYLILISYFGYKNPDLLMYCTPFLNICASDTINILVSWIFSDQPRPISWTGRWVLRNLGFDVLSDSDFEIYEVKLEELEANLPKANATPVLTFEPVLEPSIQPLLQSEPPISESDSLVSNWLIMSPPPASLSREVPICYEEIPLTSMEINSTYNLGSTTSRGRHSSQSSPSNHLRRRGGLRNPSTPSHSLPPNGDKEVIVPTDDLPPYRFTNNQANYHKQMIRYVTSFMIIAAFGTAINLVITIVMLERAEYQYPGATSIVWLNKHIRETETKIISPYDIGIYIGRKSVATGFTRFLQMKKVTYDTSTTIQAMATRQSRAFKHRDPFTLKLRRRIISDINVPWSGDFKIVYFILDSLDDSFWRLHCKDWHSSRSPVKNAISAIGLPTVKTEPRRSCAMAIELPRCILVGGQSAYKPSSGFNKGQMVQVTWIFRCVIADQE